MFWHYFSFSLSTCFAGILKLIVSKLAAGSKIDDELQFYRVKNIKST
jgi:hypothetical protein